MGIALGQLAEVPQRRRSDLQGKMVNVRFDLRLGLDNEVELQVTRVMGYLGTKHAIQPAAVKDLTHKHRPLDCSTSRGVERICL